MRKLAITSSAGGLNCLTSSITVIKGQKRGANRNRDSSGSNARLISFSVATMFFFNCWRKCSRIIHFSVFFPKASQGVTDFPEASCEVPPSHLVQNNQNIPVLEALSYFLALNLRKYWFGRFNMRWKWLVSVSILPAPVVVSAIDLFSPFVAVLLFLLLAVVMLKHPLLVK